MNKSPTIIIKRLTLRKPMESDIQDRFRCGSSWDWIRMLGGDTRNMGAFSMDDAEEWYREIMSKSFEWSIVFEEKCIGQARLSVSLTDRRARYAVGIFDNSKINMGFGTEVTNAVLQYAFETLKLHRVDLRVLEYNHRAI